MAKITFAQVNLGDSLPPLRCYITQDIIDRYAVASLDYNPVHINAEWCRAARNLFPNYFTDSTVAHGMTTMSSMASVVTDWAYPEGRITLLDCKFIRPVYPGDTITCGGIVIEKHPLGKGMDFVVLELFADNQKGVRVAAGTARVLLP